VFCKRSASYGCLQIRRIQVFNCLKPGISHRASNRDFGVCLLFRAWSVHPLSLVICRLNSFLTHYFFLFLFLLYSIIYSTSQSLNHQLFYRALTVYLILPHGAPTFRLISIRLFYGLQPTIARHKPGVKGRKTFKVRLAFLTQGFLLGAFLFRFYLKSIKR